MVIRCGKSHKRTYFCHLLKLQILTIDTSNSIDETKTGKDLYRNGSPEVMTDTTVDSISARLDGKFEVAERAMSWEVGFSKGEVF